MNELEHIAGQLYEAYCAKVGGFAFDGKPLPSWQEFRADPKKQKQSDAWVGVAQYAKILFTDPVGDVHPNTVGSCARCGQDHDGLVFKKLTNPCGELTHWCPCPTNGEPILMQVTASS